MNFSTTADAKRSKMLELFHETKDVYNLKELEKLAPAKKGALVTEIVTQPTADSKPRNWLVS